MTSLFASIPWAAAVPGVLVKSALLVLAAAVATRVPPLRRASAAARHLVWTLAVCALILLPLLTVVLPAWEVAWIPGAPRAAAMGPGAPAPRAEDGTSVPAEAVPPAEGVAAAPARGAADAGAAWPGWPRLLAGAYLLGVLAALGWVTAGFGAVRRIASGAAVVTDAGWTRLLRDVAWELEVRRPVVLLRSASSPMPMTWGVRRAAILLPAAADAWPEARRRVVLLHEMAHVARHDCLTQAIAALACALYWFHPGAWYAARQLRVERELACDDRVLAAGAGSKLYAGHLLEIARAFRAPLVLAPGVVSMARPSELEGRLLALLDTVRSRRPVARTAVLGAALAAVALVLPLAALAPASGADRAASDADRAASASGTAAAADAALAEAPPPPDTPPAEALVQTAFGGRLDLQLASASDVRITGWDRDAVQVRSWSRSGTAPGVAVRLERTAGGARIATTRSTAPGAHHVEIRVPRRYDLQIQGGGTRMEVRDLGGRIAGSTQGGDVVLAQVSGPVALATAGGTATVSASRLTGQLWTASGDAVVRGNAGDLDVRAGAGTAVVETRGEGGIPDVRRFRGGVRTVAGTDRVTLDQGEGGILVQDASEGIDVRTGRGSIHVGSAAGHALAHTARGNVTLLNAHGSVDVRTGAGNLFVQMLESREGTVTSGAGGVTLVLPADFRGRIDVTATATAGRPARQIRSDFPLRAARTGASARAAGTVGSGGPRITLTATDGDVLIRRAPPLQR